VGQINGGATVGLGMAKSNGAGQRSGTAWFARGWCQYMGYSQVSQADVFSHELGHLLNLADQYTDNSCIMYGYITGDRSWKVDPDVGGKFPEKWMTPGYILI